MLKKAYLGSVQSSLVISMPSKEKCQKLGSLQASMIRVVATQSFLTGLM